MSKVNAQYIMQDYEVCVRSVSPLVRWHHVNVLCADAQQSCSFGN